MITISRSIICHSSGWVLVNFYTFDFNCINCNLLVCRKLSFGKDSHQTRFRFDSEWWVVCLFFALSLRCMVNLWFWLNVYLPMYTNFNERDIARIRCTHHAYNHCWQPVHNRVCVVHTLCVYHSRHKKSYKNEKKMILDSLVTG